MDTAEIRNLWELRRNEWISTNPAQWCHKCNDNYAQFCECEYEKHLKLFFNKNYTNSTNLYCKYCHTQFKNPHTVDCKVKTGNVREWTSKINWNDYLI